MSKHSETSNLFLVRVWPEDESEGQVAWRGKVQHVLSGEAHSFCDWPQLIDIFLGLLPDGDAVEPAGDRSGQTSKQ